MYPEYLNQFLHREGVNKYCLSSYHFTIEETESQRKRITYSRLTQLANDGAGTGISTHMQSVLFACSVVLS